MTEARKNADCTRIALATWTILLGLALPAEAKKPPAAPPPPTFAELPGGDAVLRALEQAGFRFTPGVKDAYLAWSRSHALDRIAKTGQQLPAEFLLWVDQDPVVAATVYCGTSAAEKLVLLRSLELDLGAEEVRRRHTQLALAIVNAHAGLVDARTLANPDQGISLQEAQLLKLKIKRASQIRVDTHPQDRPLDLDDHIINFLEDHPVTEEVRTKKQVDGQEVEVLEQRTRPVYAYEVMTSSERQQAFNEYMQAHGQEVAIDCGDKITRDSPKKRGIEAAYRMFEKAYAAKGRIPFGLDPAPAPAELAAYLIRNDNYRFPAGVERRWPRFPLDAPWPVLKFLAADLLPLREREFIWDKFRETGVVKTYGPYIGKIAHQPLLVEAKHLQPAEYVRGSYPIICRNGGVCGIMSQIGRRAHTALGIPAVQAAQPGHSCFVVVTGDANSGFSLAVRQGVSSARRTRIVRGGSFFSELAQVQAVNYGLHPYLDAQIVLAIVSQLPASTGLEKQVSLLKRGLEVDPYHGPLATAVQIRLTTPRGQVEFYRWLTERLAQVDRPGCPQQGPANSVLQVGLDAQLAKLPVPADAEDRQYVSGYLSDHSDAAWLKYQLAAGGLPTLQKQLADQLKASVTGERNPTDCALLAARIQIVGRTITDAKQQLTWANELFAIVKGKAEYRFSQGKKTKTYTDPSEAAIQAMVDSGK